MWSAGLKSSSPPQQFTSSRFANSNRLTATTGLHIPISPSCSLNHSCPAWTQGKEDLRNPLSLCLLAGRSAATLSSLKGNGGTFAISARWRSRPLFLWFFIHYYQQTVSFSLYHHALSLYFLISITKKLFISQAPTQSNVSHNDVFRFDIRLMWFWRVKMSCKFIIR